MNGYLAKINYLAEKQGYNCAIAKAHGEYAMPTELHHTRCHNTIVNRRMFPLLIDSTWNLTLVSHKWHMQYPSWGKWSLLECERRENFLLRHTQIAARLNFEL